MTASEFARKHYYEMNTKEAGKMKLKNFPEEPINNETADLDGKKL